VDDNWVILTPGGGMHGRDSSCVAGPLLKCCVACAALWPVLDILDRGWLPLLHSKVVELNRHEVKMGQ
jgi:hypothetical protein